MCCKRAQALQIERQACEALHQRRNIGTAARRAGKCIERLKACQGEQQFARLLDRIRRRSPRALCQSLNQHASTFAPPLIARAYDQLELRVKRGQSA